MTPQQHIRVEPKLPKIARRARVEIGAAMGMIRLHVAESPNRETDEYLYRELLEQCKILKERLNLSRE